VRTEGSRKRKRRKEKGKKPGDRAWKGWVEKTLQERLENMSYKFGRMRRGYSKRRRKKERKRTDEAKRPSKLVQGDEGSSALKKK